MIYSYLNISYTEYNVPSNTDTKLSLLVLCQIGNMHKVLFNISGNIIIVCLNLWKSNGYPHNKSKVV